MFIAQRLKEGQSQEETLKKKKNAHWFWGQPEFRFQIPSLTICVTLGK